MVSEDLNISTVGVCRCRKLITRDTGRDWRNNHDQRSYLFGSCFFYYPNLLVTELVQIVEHLLDQIVNFRDLLVKLLGTLDRPEVVL